MLSGFYGLKVGMTQRFAEDRSVVPTTVVSLGTWYVTQVKTNEKDGYLAIQVGTPRARYVNTPFSPEWLKAKSKYFLHVRELSLAAADGKSFEVGHKLTCDDVSLVEGAIVDVTGISKGLGFQGVMRRHGFAGGPGAHGSMFHRQPGSMGNRRRRGEVWKGKRMPGRMGGEQNTIRGLRVVGIQKESGHVFICGAVPGKKGGLLKVNGHKPGVGQ